MITKAVLQQNLTEKNLRIMERINFIDKRGETLLPLSESEYN